MAMGGGGSSTEASPYINVTPLIDVLLVLLIIFMVISPQKPHRFEAKIPDKPPDNQEMKDNPFSLLVTVQKGSAIYKLNQESLDGLGPLKKRLLEVLTLRPADQKAVFIKAPSTVPYGDVVKVIDVMKEAGATPIGLQIEGIDQ